MKRLGVATVVVGLAIAGVGYWSKPKTESAASANDLAEAEQPKPDDGRVKEGYKRVERSAPPGAEPDTSSIRGFTSKRPTRPDAAAANLGDTGHSLISQSVDVLVSTETPFERKRAVWNELRQSGKLDQAIAELEKRMTDAPQDATYPATLGTAYLKKCAIIQDVREQGILALQADKLFDTALGLDPANWEARFTKAVSLSYWPETMNKGGEVIEHFETLLQHQEAQAPQPHFAETYLWLGEQYQKAGRVEDAQSTWQRGSSLYPANDSLKKKLAVVN